MFTAVYSCEIGPQMLEAATEQELVEALRSARDDCAYFRDVNIFDAAGNNITESISQSLTESLHVDELEK